MERAEIDKRLNFIESQPGWQAAFDGCHKIYIIENTVDQREEARTIGYDLYPASEVRDLINRSCGLVFVNRWALDAEGNTGFKTEWTIDQFEMPEDWYSENGGKDI